MHEQCIGAGADRGVAGIGDALADGEQKILIDLQLDLEQLAGAIAPAHRDWAVGSERLAIGLPDSVAIRHLNAFTGPAEMREIGFFGPIGCEQPDRVGIGFIGLEMIEQDEIVDPCTA